MINSRKNRPERPTEAAERGTAASQIKIDKALAVVGVGRLGVVIAGSRIVFGPRAVVDT